jgi:membrane protein
VWHEKLASELGKLRRVRIARGRAADLLLPSLRYIFSTEVHAYAFSIAANAYLSLFPFSLMLLAVCRRWLRWEGAYQMVLQLLRVYLPVGAESVVRNLVVLVQGRPRLQLMSVLMLFFTISGVFLPLEIALNKVWGFERNRSFLKNQAVSFFLALAAGVLALASILVNTTLQWIINAMIGWIPWKGFVALFSRGVLEVTSIPLAVLIFFLVYYFLPNGRVPFPRVLSAAIVTGLLTEGGRVIYFLTLPLFRFREVYGPFALSVTLLFWAYTGALILLFGAHLSARGFGQKVFSKPVPAANNAEKLSPQSGT